jgi:glycerol-3-phosphate dehydrogenase
LPGYSQGEITYLVEQEMVTHLDDFLIRRSKLAWINQVSIDSITELAGIIGEELNWDDTKKQQEINRTCEILKKRHGVVL